MHLAMTFCRDFVGIRGPFVDRRANNISLKCKILTQLCSQMNRLLAMAHVFDSNLNRYHA